MKHHIYHSMAVLVRATDSGKSLVGRSAEIDAIADALSTLSDGRGQVLMLAGEPGIGKSTLARLAADRAREQDIAVYSGFSWEDGGAPTIPLALQVGRVVKMGSLAWNLAMEGEYTVVNAGSAPIWSLRFGVSLLIPE